MTRIYSIDTVLYLTSSFLVRPRPLVEALRGALTKMPKTSIIEFLLPFNLNISEMLRFLKRNVPSYVQPGDEENCTDTVFDYDDEESNNDDALFMMLKIQYPYTVVCTAA